jgi:NAD(P)H-hydrate epimerase
MAGAIALAGRAALRGGAGLVTLAVPAACQPTVASFDPCFMTWSLPDDLAGRIAVDARETLAPLVAGATCVACGPGLGRSDGLTALVGWLYKALPQPLVLDADGLNALAARPAGLHAPGGPRILTPHPGEFRRLVGDPQQTIEQCRQAAVRLAARHQVVIVLKGHRTLITDGQRSVENSTGNPGMATGGAGDVLTGVITALVGQGLAAFEAAQLGVYLHGLAGDLAACEMGEVSLVASDLVQWLPAAIRRASGNGS